jgi:hypothetical protein
MKLMRFFAATILMLIFAAPVVAGPYEDAIAAYITANCSTFRFKIALPDFDLDQNNMLLPLYYIFDARIME